VPRSSGNSRLSCLPRKPDHHYLHNHGFAKGSIRQHVHVYSEVDWQVFMLKVIGKCVNKPVYRLMSYHE
jgi:hypothetical protein